MELLDIGVVLGLLGHSPDNISNEILEKARTILNNKILDIGSKGHNISFDFNKNFYLLSTHFAIYNELNVLLNMRNDNELKEKQLDVGLNYNF